MFDRLTARILIGRTGATRQQQLDDRSLSLVGEAQKMVVLISGLWGILIYVGVDAISSLLEKEESDGSNVGEMVKRGGIGAFLYLEVLDASFSFDGVIGAFAITTATRGPT